jgi:poly-gamma-glutamate synthesis protein (capsule biosynthesis protein)
MNVIANVRSIHDAKKEADIVILIVHGGNENFSYPSPRIVDQYRFYAEQGASIIISHHSHCISGYEIYKKVPIFYGLGNFLFDSKTDFVGWYQGLLLNIKINQKKEISWEFYPYEQCKDESRIKLLDGKEKLKNEAEIRAINEIIADPEKLKAKYNDLVNSRNEQILSIFSTSYIFNYKYFRSAIRKLGIEKFFIRRDQLKLILNLSRCESLKDVTFDVLENYLRTKR